LTNIFYILIINLVYLVEFGKSLLYDEGKILFEDPDKEDKNDKRRTEVQMQYLRKRS